MTDDRRRDLDAAALSTPEAVRVALVLLDRDLAAVRRDLDAAGSDRSVIRERVAAIEARQHLLYDALDRMRDDDPTSGAVGALARLLRGLKDGRPAALLALAVLVPLALAALALVVAVGTGQSLAEVVGAVRGAAAP